MGLRIRLLLLVGAAFVPAGIVIGYLSWSVRETETRHLRDETSRLVQLSASTLAQQVEGVRQLLETIASLPELRDRRDAELSAVFRELQRRNPAYANIGAVTPEGAVFASALPIPPGIGLADRAYFRDALRTRAFSVGEYQVGRITGKATINFAMPVYDADRLHSVVFAALGLDWLSGLQSRASLPAGASLLVIDRNGITLVSIPAPPAEPFRLQVAARSEGTFESEDRIAAVAPVPRVPENGLRIAAAVPLTLADERAARYLTRGLLGLAAGAILALAAGWIGSGWLVVRPAQALLAAIERHKSGDLSARAGHAGTDELGRLGRAFDEMAAALQRRQSELSLSEERFRLLAESSPVAIAAHRGGHAIWANAAFLKMFGLTTVAGIGPGGLNAPSVRAEMADIARRRAAGEAAPESYESLGLRADGTEFPIHVRAAAITLADGPATVVFIEDLTERRRIEDALRAGEQRFRALIESAPIGIGVVRRGVTMAMNPAGLRMLGAADPTEIIGRPMIDTIAPDCRDQVTAIARARESGGPAPASYETVGLRRDGSLFPMLIQIAMIRLPDGPAAVGFVTDLTEQRRAESALRESEERLRQTQKMEAVGRLAGGVAHDFNNLLQVIQGFATSLLAELPAGSPARAHAEEIARAAIRAASVTRQLLAFSRRSGVELRVIDLNDVVRGMTGLLERLLGADVELAVALDSSPARVRADRGQIEQVLLNFAANARDAMPRGGTLRISTRLEGASAVIEVTDTGEGMDEATRARLFEPFFTTKAQGQGTGLGLATVYGAVTQAGGRIEVDSTPGRGTTFRVFLPRTEDPVEPAPDPALPRGGDETLLVVEDEPGILHFLGTTLRMAGYRVLEAPAAPAAIDQASRHAGPIHLLVTDVILPQLGGPELAERLAAARPDLRVLYVSGHTGDARVPEERLLRKPFPAEELLVRVRRILDDGR